MNRKVIAILFAVALVMSVASMGMAATTTQKIEFNLIGSYGPFNPSTQTWTSVEASAILTGKIMAEDGTHYLSPLAGTITIGSDGIDYQIVVTQPKQSESEPVMYYEGEEVGGTFKLWYALVEVNIKGNKCIGELYWGTYLDYKFSGLEFKGIADRELVKCELYGDFPE